MYLGSQLWYQHVKGILETLGFVPNSEEGCDIKRGIEDIQCTVIAHVKDQLVTCKDEAAIVGVTEALGVKYHDVQEEHTSVKHLYLHRDVPRHFCDYPSPHTGIHSTLTESQPSDK